MEKVNILTKILNKIMPKKKAPKQVAKKVLPNEQVYSSLSKRQKRRERKRLGM